jgi:hypothetical protein
MSRGVSNTIDYMHFALSYYIETGALYQKHDDLILEWSLTLIYMLTFHFIISLEKFDFKLKTLANFVAGDYTSIWEKISASETKKWGVHYHKSETECTSLLEEWKKSKRKVNIGHVIFHKIHLL